MNPILEYEIALTVSIVVIIGVTLFLFKAVRNEKLIKPFRSQKVLFGFLFSWTLFGFFTQQDFTECCPGQVTRGIFSPDYIIFSAISLIFLLVGVLSKNKIIRISILSIELTYWIFKLFILKSGYLGELEILVFFYYDFIGLLGRLLLLNCIFGEKLKEHLISLIAGLLILVKMLFVPCNENSTYRYYVNSYYTNVLFQNLNGSWTGSIIYVKDSTICKTINNPDTALYGNIPEINQYRDSSIQKKYKIAYVFFNDSNLVIEKASTELNGKYNLNYSQPETGFLVYLPIQYVEDAKKDYHYKQYHIKVILGILSDSTLSFTIDHRTEISLKKRN